VRAVRTRYVVEGWGEGELWTGDGVVLAHDFEFERVRGAAPPALRDAVPALPLGGASPPSGTVAADRAQLVDGIVTSQRQHEEPVALDPDALAALIRAFLAGEDVPLADVPLDLSASTPFQREVVATLRHVPRGEVVSYGELAALAGYPRAGRAVGTVCATNCFMFLVPCHRVVASDGIGGYGSAGVGVKRRLLALEGVSL
jgi:methylated-DNA-[protein]-cysteine S-methyltransferase